VISQTYTPSELSASESFLDSGIRFLILYIFILQFGFKDLHGRANP
jgi:hypothetical protein